MNSDIPHNLVPDSVKNGHIAVHDPSNTFWLPTWNTVVVTNDVTKPFAFDKVTLAFEVDLQLTASGDLDVEERVAQELQASVTQQLKAAQHVIVKHLVLNLKSEFYFSGKGCQY